MINTELTGFETEIIFMVLEDYINHDDFDQLHPTAKDQINKLLTKFENLR